ncbi:NifU-like protein [Mycoplasma haemocanis str. Illinois]|uniref:NifU-like protein n=1 Tax=Mycoplasma haemocanis (strain Illinois) TaxID=1111676 RepID=H6N5Z1_MYCHN|nr:iron-sulfur cluster assembly scaffold protein [Mycoplasma haemocanis]AEW45063.1 NifU-like protein [Mycoplasma haemocanis str. Illinois]
MSRLEIFRLFRSDKYLSKEEYNGSDLVNGNGCNDWCNINFSNTGKIENLKFDHRGCIISRASINALLEAISNKTVSEAKEILLNYKSMIMGGSYESLSDELLLFKRIAKYSSRRSCLLVGCDFLLKRLDES